jgi:crossover junction endodeoxyribonuclease RusA
MSETIPDVRRAPVVGEGREGPGGTTFTLEFPARMRLPSLNDRGHWSVRYRAGAAVKDAAIVLARQARIPCLACVSVVVEYRPPDRRRRDADNLAAAGKAAIDGIVLAGVLPDDDAGHVISVRYEIGEPCPGGQLVLHITEVLPEEPPLRGV